MIKKQTSISMMTIALLVLACVASLLIAPSVGADPSSTKIECKNGKTVTAKKNHAKPNDVLDRKDYVAACKGHGGMKNNNKKKDPPEEEIKCETSILPKSLCTSGEDVENNGIWKLLILVLNIMTAGVGLLAVGGIVYGAILYASAEDSTEQVNKAKNIIFNVVVGLIAFAFMYAGLNFLIPGGIFT